MLTTLEPITLDTIHYPGGFERQVCMALADHCRRLGWWVQREAPLGAAGRLDLFAQKGERFLVIEVKWGRADRHAVEQLERYYDAVLGSGIGGEAVAILAAESLTRTIRDLPEGMCFQPYKLVPWL